MIRFCYSPTGNYNIAEFPDHSESFLIDKANYKLRLFDQEDFYFSKLDASFLDCSDGSVGLSMLGAWNLYNTVNASIRNANSSIVKIKTDITNLNTSTRRTCSSVNRIEWLINGFNFNKNYIYAVDGEEGVSDLDIADSSGNVIVRLNEGHVATKYFDSSDITTRVEYLEENAVVNAPVDDPDADLDFVDPSGNVIMRLYDGHIKTKHFDSLDCSDFNFHSNYPYLLNHVYSERDEADLDVADSSGNVILRLKDGHIKTKNFDSEKVIIPDTEENLESYVEGKFSAVIDTIDGLDEYYATISRVQTLEQKFTDELQKNEETVAAALTTFNDSLNGFTETYATKEYIAGIIPSDGGVAKGYVDEEIGKVNTSIGTLRTYSDTTFATKEELNRIPTGVATETYVDGSINKLNTALTSYIDGSINTVKNTYATLVYTDASINLLRLDVSKVLQDNEEVWGAALVDINDRLNTLSQQVTEILGRLNNE